MNKIDIAITGLGRIASLLEEDTLREKPCTHAGAITSNSDCRLVAGCDISEERRLLFAKKWKVPVYEDANEMFFKHKPQILVIATHPDSHYHYCRLAAENKIPVIICEKPLADTLKEARKIKRLIKNGTKIVTNHERRYSLDYICAKTILEEKRLGELLSVRACLYMGKNRRLIDQFWHDATHLADVIMFLTNSTLKHIKTIGSKLTARNGTVWLVGKLSQKISHRGTEARSFQSRINELPVIIEIGAQRDHLVFEIELSCEKGRLRIGNGVFEVWESIPSPYAENFRSLKNTGENFCGQTGYFSNMLKDAIRCVKEPGCLPVSGATDGLKVIEYLNSVSKWKNNFKK